jgi:thiamine-phosphate pyrophosphorylase
MDQDECAEARATLARVAAALNARNVPAQGLPPLILMTDDRRDADYVEAAGALPSGSAVIIRHRDAAQRARLGQALAEIAMARGSRCLIANDVALAERIAAAGMHASEASIGEIAAWRARHPQWLITAAIHAKTPFALSGANAALLGPVFATSSHPGAAPLGVAGFDAIAKRAGLPVYALGGITSENAGRLAASRAAGIALISGWLRNRTSSR